MSKYSKYYANPVYREARDDWMIVQEEQIRKGAEKYPEPLNPASWTGEQLVRHGMQEVVDLTHYLTAMKFKFQEMERDIRYLYDLVVKDSEIGRRLVEENLREDRPIGMRLETIRRKYRL